MNRILLVLLTLLAVSPPLILAVLFYIAGSSFWWWLIAPLISLSISIPLGVGLGDACIEFGGLLAKLDRALTKLK